jgi:TetR/AcrR family transcriptional regulator, tetracycline repressor protein
MVTCTPYNCQMMSAKPQATRLTKSAVVDRALQLADSSGLEALTIRKLAADLGVTPMALYWHFRSKEELLDGLAERLWSEIHATVDSAAAPWPAQLRGLLESLVTVLRAHPAAPLVLQQHKPQSGSALRVTETALEILRGAGFDPEHATAIAQLGLQTGIMLVMSEPGAEMLPGEDRAELQRVKQVRLATLPVADYPRLVECAVPMTACDNPEFHYEFGINLFVAGVQAMAPRAAAS